MQAEVAIEKLRELKSEASEPLRLKDSPELLPSWVARARAVIGRSLGLHHDLITRLDQNRYTPGAYSSSSPASLWTNSFTSGVQRACGYLDAAIYELELELGDDELVDERSFDPELWERVRGLVEAADWELVPSTVVIFVEDKLRTWAGLDTDAYGKGLYGKALANAGVLRLGARESEWEGWRALGTGFAQAIGNVDRHRLQKRDDARRYAVGVLGLGSLLLTQLRYEHAELVTDAEEGPANG